MIIKFRIIEIENPDENCMDCLQTAHRFMVEEIETGARWFGSSSRSECEDYIIKYTG
ncbi:hypothetical protein N9P49_00225 [bacterium]|jgi:hypothetical protein|nr:hypothetical protein [bacterium]